MNKISHSRKPLLRFEVEFEPIDPNMSPAKDGPLEVVSKPTQRIDVQMEPATIGFDQVLSIPQLRVMAEAVAGNDGPGCGG